MSGSGGEDIRHHIKVYVGVFATLMVLTLITVGVSYMRLAIVFAVTVAMIVATVKGSLVAAYFMHLKSERPAIFWILIVMVLFWVHLMALPVLMYLNSYQVR